MINKFKNFLSGTKEKPDSVKYQAAWAFFEKRHEAYEESTAALAKLLKPGAVVIDVGANVGYFSTMLSAKVARLELHLFEPLPNLGTHCQKTISDRALNAKFYPFALSDKNGEFNLYIAADGNIGWNTLEKEKASTDMREVKVTTKRFDELGLERVDLIKIDVEGAEWRVLSGMMPWLERQLTKPIIQVEIGWGITHPHWNNEMEQFEKLLAMGYRVQDFTGNPVNLTGLSSTTDVVFIIN
jgi:FkbM family methyltransferase